MNFNTIEKALAKRDISRELLKIDTPVEKLNLSNSEKRKVQKCIEIFSVKLKFIPTLNYITIGLLYDKENTLDTIRRKGLLRYSKYIEAKNFPEPLVKAILNLRPELHLSKADRLYFESILNFSPIYKIMKNLRAQIVKEMRSFSKKTKINRVSPSIVKTLLAKLDFLFMISFYPQERKTTNSIGFYFKEDIAEAISYIIHLKQEVFGLKQSDSYVVDEEYIVSDEINNILKMACHIKALQEYEIMIDHFSYTCIKDKNNIRIIPSSADFEKSIRIGYIRNELQHGYDFKEFKNIVSLEDLCDKFLSIQKFEVFKYVEDYNYPRYIIEIAEPIYDKISELFFRPKQIFREEAQYLSIIFKEQFLDYDKLKGIKISEHLSLLEFFILKRLFIFFFYIFLKKTSDKLQTETKTILRSIIPTFTNEQLARFYKGIVSEQAFNEFLNIVAWKPNKKSVFDIQYQPFIKLNNVFMIPIGTFVNSNSIRNVFSSEYKQGNPNIMDNGKYDPISDSLIEIFSHNGFKTFTHKSHSYKQGGEIDFLAFKDDLLFFAECKKFLVPTNIYEQRTIYDGLIKASSQLDLILKAIEDEKASKKLSILIGEDINRFKIVKTSIITNTRLFVGLSFKKHPIRNIYELYNFMSEGKLRSKDGHYWLWENNYFALNDLLRYFDNDFSIFKGLYNAMQSKEIVYKFGKYNIYFETFAMSIEKAENITKNLALRKVE